MNCKGCNSKFAVCKGSRKIADDTVPRILHCGHVFCERCLKNRVLDEKEDDDIDGGSSENYSLICPFIACKSKTKLPSGDISFLPKHQFIIATSFEKLDETTIRKKKSQKQKAPAKTKSRETACANCNTKPASLSCDQCTASMCENCFNLIHSNKVLKNHVPKPLLSEPNSGEDCQPLRLQLTDRCDTHVNKHLEYYCVTCSVGLCGDCAILGAQSHMQHTIQKLEQINKEVRPRLIEMRQQINTALSLSQQSEQRLAVYKGCEGAVYNNPLVQQIDEVFIMIYSKLQLKHHELREKVIDTTSGYQVLYDLHAQLKESQTQLEQVLEVLDRVVSSQELEASCNFTDIEEKAQEYLQLPCHLVVNDNVSSSQSSIKVDDEKINGLLDAVSFQAPSPSQERFQLVTMDKVSPEEIQSCPPALQKAIPDVSTRQPPVGKQVEAAPVNYADSVDDVYSYNTATSPGRSSVHSLSRKSSQASTASNQPLYQRSRRSDSYSPYDDGTYNPYDYYREDVGMRPAPGQIPGVPTGLDSYGRYDDYRGYTDHDPYSRHQMTDRAGRKPQRKGPSHLPSAAEHKFYEEPSFADFQNFEASGAVGKKRREQYSPQNPDYPPPPQAKSDFRCRDIRLIDPHYTTSSDFVLCAEDSSFPPDRPQFKPFGVGLPNPSIPLMKTAGRGRARPAPVFAPPGTCFGNQLSKSKASPKPVIPQNNNPYNVSNSCNNSNPADQRKLYMKASLPIKESQVQVRISHIENPGLFYIQHIKGVTQLKHLQLKLNEHAASQPPVYDLNGVKFLLGKYENSCWARCELRKVKDRNVTVFFSDYGVTSVLKSSDLRHTAGHLLAVPRLATKCYLKGIQPADGGPNWSASSIKAMKDVIYQKSSEFRNTTILRKLDASPDEENFMPVDILIKDDMNDHCVLSLQEYLVFCEVAVWDSPVSPYRADAHMMKQVFLTPSPLKDGDYIKLLITHALSPEAVYFQIINREILLQENGEKVDASYDAEVLKLLEINSALMERYSIASSEIMHQVFAPKPGQAVAAFYLEAWYRAQVMELMPGKIKVKFVDYGNEEIVSPGKIRCLTKSFTNLPAQAVKASIYGIKSDSAKWDPEATNQFQTLCQEQIAYGKVVVGGHGNLQIIFTLNDTQENLGDLLVRRGLAIRTVDKVTKDEGVECRCTHVVSPGEIYMQALHLEDEIESMIQGLDNYMQEHEGITPSVQWQVNDNCLVKHGQTWVRAIIEELNSEAQKCKLRLIDSGVVISKPLDSLRAMTEEVAALPSMCTVCSIDGILPTGGTEHWGNIAKEFIHDLLENCESCKVIPKGKPSGNVLPCDIVIPEEIPSRIMGKQGEITYVSVKEKLLEAGVALKDMNTPKLSPERDSVPRGKISKLKISDKLVSSASQHVSSADQLDVDDDDMPPLNEALSGNPVDSPNQTNHSRDPQPKRQSNSQANAMKVMSRSAAGARNKLVKSPGGSIKSLVKAVAEDSDHSSQSSARSHAASDPVTQLLSAAASALTSQSGSPKRKDWAEEVRSSSSSSDLPTPELYQRASKMMAGVTDELPEP